MRRRLLLPALLAVLLLSACGQITAPTGTAKESTGRMELQYAQHFSVDTYDDGSALLTLGGQDHYLLLPPGLEAGASEGLTVIHTPVEKIYLASSSVADLFLQMDALDAVRYTSTQAGSWQIPEMQEALASGEILFAGKYSAPDYELLLTEGCGLVVENTMILHNPETREKLIKLGLPVMIEYSSYEPHPLGRVEWIKLYGLLTGRLEEAEAFFERQVQTFTALENAEKSGKTAAFFHITANGAVVVRKENDYVNRMIELAGGENAITDLPPEDNALSTMTIQMESFYAQARDADVLIYNSTVTGELETLEQLLEQSPLLADFKAVRTGQVWCTEQSMFQRSSAAADMIADFHQIFSGEPENGELNYLHRVQ